MDTPIEEQRMFQNVTSNVAASEQEIVEPNILSVEFISYVEAEVFRLEELKASKMKELVFKKRSELEEICRKTHMIPESDIAMEAAIDASSCIKPDLEAKEANLGYKQDLTQQKQNKFLLSGKKIQKHYHCVKESAQTWMHDGEAYGIVPCVLHLLGLLFIPESPRWLAKTGREKDSESALQRLRGKNADISAESAEIRASFLLYMCLMYFLCYLDWARA